MANLAASSKLLTAAETAAELGVSRETVYRRVESGEWPAIRLGSGPKAPIRIDPDRLVESLSAASQRETRTPQTEENSR